MDNRVGMSRLRRKLEIQDSSIGDSLMVHEDVEFLLKARKGLEDEVPFVVVGLGNCGWSWLSIQSWGWRNARSDC